jgi:hypothetical protein
LLDQDFPEFKDDMNTLRELGVIIGDDESNSLSVPFIDKLSDYMRSNPEEFTKYDMTEGILHAIAQVLSSYSIKKEEMERFTLIITSWIDIMLKNGGFYDLN